MITALVIVVSYAGFASPLVVLMTFVASLCCALSIAEFARRLPSAGWAYTYNSPLGPLVTPGRFGQRALAHVAGTSAPPSSVIRASKRSSAGWDEIFPAIRPSPWRKATERSITARLQRQAVQRGLETEPPPVNRGSKRKHRRLETPAQLAETIEVLHAASLSRYPDRAKERS